MNAIENKNSNHLAAPRLHPYHATVFAMNQLQKSQMLAVAGSLLIWCCKNRRSSTYRAHLWRSWAPQLDCLVKSGVPNLWYAKVFHVLREQLPFFHKKTGFTAF